MNKYTELTTLNIDPEIESLHLPLKKVSLKELEATISEKGPIRPIKIWNGFIIDGHKHYRIYREKKIPFSIKEYAFNNRFDAMAWVCQRNLLRKDLTEEYRKYYIGKLFLSKYASAEEQGITKEQYLAKGESVPRDTPVYTRQDISNEIGKAYNISNTAIYTSRQYAEAIDTLKEKEKDIAISILTGNARISIENVIKLSALTPEELKSIKPRFTEKQDTDHKRLSMSDIRHDLQWYRLHHKEAAKKKPPASQAGIKIMPKYDPDAELSSLSLTIPTWKSSIERVDTAADFPHSSENARKKLLKQLSNLSDTVTQITKHIKETENAQLFRAGSNTEPGSEPGAESEPVCTECTLRADTDKEPCFEPGIPA